MAAKVILLFFMPKIITNMCDSPFIEGVHAGRLVHLAGLDVIGATAGSITRLIADREIELWEGKRIVGAADPEEVILQYQSCITLNKFPQLTSGELSLAHPSLRVISTASKSLPLQDWLIDEHANAFFSIPLQPMGVEEEREVLLGTGCRKELVSTLLLFAEKYRLSLTQDNAQKKRKLGTRALKRIAQRLVKYPQDDDLHTVISRTLLAEFLPPIEKLALLDLLKETNINPAPPTVRFS